MLNYSVIFKMYIKILRRLILGFILSILIFFSHPQTIFADSLGSWSNTTNLPNPLASHISYTSANKISVVGGANTVVVPTNISSVINNADGSLLPWISSGSALSLFWHSSAIKDNFLYVLGGATFPPTVSINTVYKGVIDNQGVITSWTSLTPLPQNLSIGSSTVVGTRLYFAGGFTNGGSTNQNVYFANINVDGTIGSWTIAGLLPEPMSGFGMVENGNNLIVFGGYTGSVYSDKVYRASINLDGTISAFIETAALPEAVYRSAYIKVGSTIISAGGRNGTNSLNKIYYANINLDGTIDSWQQSANNLPEALYATAAAYANGFMYVTGGHNDALYFNTVYYAPVNVSNEIDLAVPLLKQTEPLWGGFMYDSADQWAPPPEPVDIARWGCALTSAAMVFQYYGITKLPNGIDLNPGTLNVFLKNDINLDSTKDGYRYEGHVNWAELSNISKLGKSQNPGFAYDVLEFSAYDGHNNDLLQNDIENGNPVILQEPGHFVVAKGINEDDKFKINDPFYEKSSLSEYGDTSLSMKRFIPADSDLSYIVVSTQDSINMILKDSLGNEVGMHTTEYPIKNPETGTDNGDPAKFIYFSKPTGGDYSILVNASSPTNYEIQILTYDSDGQHEKFIFSGIVEPGDEDNYSIAFDKNNSGNSTSTQDITFDSLIADIKSLYSLHEINFGNYLYLLVQARTAKGLSGNQVTKAGSIALLKAMDRQILRAKGRGVSNNAYNILHNDIQTLLSSI
ncbi:MAG: C39 family peptidase [Candidatus Levybacteria bacterium]|nr:C39 family peptidase [Candidatus Levybacteria bacterium]